MSLSLPVKRPEKRAESNSIKSRKDPFPKQGHTSKRSIEIDGKGPSTRHRSFRASFKFDPKSTVPQELKIKGSLNVAQISEKVRQRPIYDLRIPRTFLMSFSYISNESQVLNTQNVRNIHNFSEKIDIACTY